MKCFLIVVKSLLFASLLMVLIWAVTLILPARWKPWVPFTIEQTLDAEIKTKLLDLSNHPRSCLAVLSATDQTSLQYGILSDHMAPPDCQLDNAILVHRTSLKLPQPMIVQCPLLVSWLMFEQQQLQPLAQQHLGQKIQQIQIMSSFSCRNVYGRKNGKRSQHARAAALDIGGFLLADNSRVSVLQDWQGDDAKSTFLKAVRNAACDYFGTVLGPDYNSAHHNHFHLDFSDSGLCQ